MEKNINSEETTQKALEWTNVILSVKFVQFVVMVKERENVKDLAVKLDSFSKKEKNTTYD